MEGKNTENKYYWFAARTILFMELKMRAYFENHQIEYCIPTRKIFRGWKEVKMELEVPVIRSLVFFKADRAMAESVFGQNKGILYRIHRESGIVCVPEDQMEPFIRLVNEYEGQVDILDPGSDAAAKGPANNDHVVCLDGLLVASVEFP